MKAKIYFDGENAVLGRVGSLICKELLKGKEVVLINSEKVIISGRPEVTIEGIRHWKNLGGKGMKGPKVSRLPDRLVKRMIRGMLPWDRTKGREAYDRLRCYVGNGPLKAEELKSVKKVADKTPLNFISIKEISRLV